VPAPSGDGYNEHYYIANPGYGYSLPVSQGGKMSDDFWPTPKAVRDYKGLNIELIKRLSNNWMGGVNVTLSRLWGNYTGIVSADESVNGAGRASGNVCRYFDVWWMSYSSSGRPDPVYGYLPTDRPVVAKAFGSYHFPFGLTVGIVANWMSGIPTTTEFYVDRANGYFPFGRNDLGRTPSLYFVNLSAEYNLKIGKNTLQFLFDVDNATDNDTAIFNYRRLNWGTPRWRDLVGGQANVIPTIKAGFDPMASKNSTWPNPKNTWYPHPMYNKANVWYQPMTARLGVKFIF